MKWWGFLLRQTVQFVTKDMRHNTEEIIAKQKDLEQD